MLPGLRTNVSAPAAISLSQRRSSTVNSQRLRVVCRAEDEKVVTLLDYGMFMTLNVRNEGFGYWHCIFNLYSL
jgi:hypothetical protein